MARLIQISKCGPIVVILGRLTRSVTEGGSVVVIFTRPQDFLLSFFFSI